MVDIRYCEECDEYTEFSGKLCLWCTLVTDSEDDSSESDRESINDESDSDYESDSDDN